MSNIEQSLDFGEVGRLPDPNDNVAIATRRLEAGTRVSYEGEEFEMPHTVLEGHRFAVGAMPEGERPPLLGPHRSGRALRDIAPGDYACNEKILRVLRERFRDHSPDPATTATPREPPTRAGAGCRAATAGPASSLPDEPNFRDAELEPYVPGRGRPSGPDEQVPLHDEPRTFMGYRRGGGAGRRDAQLRGRARRHLAANGFVRALECEMNGVSDAYENIDGIVAVAHTEGGEDRTPNNLDLLLRTLSGFMVNPNVGAVLALDDGGRGGRHERDAPLATPRSTTTRSGRRAARVHEPAGGASGPTSSGPRPWWRAGWTGRERGRAHRGAGVGAQDRAAVRRVGRVLGRLGQPAGRVGHARRSCATAGRQPGRDRRAYRGRALRPEERAGRGDGAALSGDRRAVQGAGRLARAHGRGQPFRRQQLPRPLQHLHKVHRRRAARRTPTCASTASSSTRSPCAGAASTSWTAPATTSRASPGRSPRAPT